MSTIADNFGRPIEYVRISVTDRCDMRCVYCMPAEGVDFTARSKLLTYEEIERITRALAPVGVRSVRITGGEPLVRKDVVELVRRVASVPGIEDVAMTTNARLLPRYANDLKAAGLGRLNVSLDSVDRASFAKVTRGDHLPAVLEGIDAALEAGFDPIKLNTVVVRGENDGEVAEVVRFARRKGLMPRFIELMPMGSHAWFGPDRLVSSAEVRSTLEEAGLQIEPEPNAPIGRGPARYWRVREVLGDDIGWTSVGFISPLTENFCDACNRIRVTATGAIRACLGWDDTHSLRDVIHAGGTDEDLRVAVQLALRGKLAGHIFASDGSGNTDVTMSSVGG